MKTLNQIATNYFAENSLEREGVVKAYYAYHVEHFRLDPKAHNFTNSSRTSRCAWCQRSREEVRHDELPASCQARPATPEVAEAIHTEEQRAFSLAAKAERDVPRLLTRLGGLTGQTLSILHHTHGYDPETVASIVSVEPSLLADYHTAMETERSRSRESQVKQVITL